MNLQLDITTNRRVQFKEVTTEVAQLVRNTGIDDGQLLLFVPHTTAAITINENADPDVVCDLILGLERLVPTNAGYRHAEGNSDAHIKSSLIGPTEQLIIRQGELLLGTWQGIYFCEFDGPRSRRLLLKLSPDRP